MSSNPDPATIAAELGLPPIDQVGWVVRDLDRALETYGPIFGPFTTMDTALEGTNYRGRPSNVTLRMAFGRSGPVEIELIEWVAGDCPHKEALDAGQEGVHPRALPRRPRHRHVPRAARGARLHGRLVARLPRDGHRVGVPRRAVGTWRGDGRAVPEPERLRRGLAVRGVHRGHDVQRRALRRRHLDDRVVDVVVLEAQRACSSSRASSYVHVM